jgi:hypothetical protein
MTGRWGAMTTTTTSFTSRRLVPAAVVSLLCGGALALAPAAEARRGDDDGRLISRFSGSGKRACAVAKQRVGGGSACLSVRKHARDDDGSVYEVDVRRRGARWEVDLTARFRVVDVSRDDRGDDDRGRGDDD